MLKDLLFQHLYFHQKHLTYPTDHAPLADLCRDMIWWKILTIDLRKYLKASQSKNNWCSTDYAGDRCEAGAEHYCHRWDGVTKTDSSSNFLDIVDDCTQKMKQFLHLLGDIFQPKVCGKVVIGNGFFTDIKLF